MNATFKLVRNNRHYRRLLYASATSNLGDGIALLAFPWLATLVSRDPVHISLVAFATRLPWLLFSIPAGVIIDRIDRKKLMVSVEIIRVALTVVTIVFVTTSTSVLVKSQVPLDSPLSAILVLATIALLLGTAEVFRDNAAQTVMPAIVESEQLEQANGQLWSVEQVMGSFVGPPLAGFLIAVSLPAPFAFNAIVFALSAWFLCRIKLPLQRSAEVTQSFFAQMVEGLAWISRHRVVLQLAVMLGLLNAFAMMTLTVLVLFSQEVLLLTSVGYGMLLTSMALGGVLGGLICPILVNRMGARTSLYVALAIFPISSLIVGCSRSALIVGAALLVEMCASVLWNVVTVSYRQRVIPNNILGRVNSIYRCFGWGMMPVGALAGGLIVSLAEPQFGREIALRLPFFSAAAGGLLVFLYALNSLRELSVQSSADSDV